MQPLNDIHGDLPLVSAGTPLDKAQVALIMIHGRGSSANNMLSLAPALSMPGVGFLAPQASGGTWYPYPFMSPIEMNEPGISSGMSSIDRAIEHAASAGIPKHKVVLLGFSQGACLTSEYVARHATKYGGVIVLSGGLIGPDGTARDYAGSLNGTPCFLGCSDVDAHIPAKRVSESADLLTKLGGSVTLRLYEGMGHSINDDEIVQVRHILSTATHNNSTHQI